MYCALKGIEDTFGILHRFVLQSVLWRTRASGSMGCFKNAVQDAQPIIAESPSSDKNRNAAFKQYFGSVCAAAVWGD